jgi:putative membrane protein
VQTLAIILAALAAGVHVFIFYLESIAWESPQARATFGITSDAEARHTKPLAFNQGFYNLFLAILALVGAVLLVMEHTVLGASLALAGTGCMLAAALVLLLSSREHRGAAVKQGIAPLFAVLALVIVLVA